MSNYYESPEAACDQTPGFGNRGLKASGVRLWGTAGLTPIALMFAVAAWLGCWEGTRFELPDSANPIIAALFFACAISLLVANLGVYCPLVTRMSRRQTLRRWHIALWIGGSAVLLPTIVTLTLAFLTLRAGSQVTLVVLLSAFYLSPPILASQLLLLLSGSRAEEVCD